MKKFMKLGVIGASAALLVACGNNSTQQIDINEEDIIAKINDKVITQRELTDQLIIDNGSMTLQSMIIQDVVSQELSNKEIEEAKADVELLIQTEKENAGGEEYYLESLRNQGYDSIEQVKGILLSNRLISKYVEGTIEPTKENIEDAISNNIFAPRISIRGILVSTEESAKEVIEKLNDGEDWVKLHDELNMDYGTYQDKGMMPEISLVDGTMDGYITPPTVPYQVIETVKESEIGLIQEPIPTGDGNYYVVEILFDGDIERWDEYSDLISEQYMNSLLNNQLYITSTIGDLIKKYDIEIPEERYAHILSGLTESAGIFEIISSNSNQQFIDGDNIQGVEGQVVDEVIVEDNEVEVTSPDEVVDVNIQPVEDSDESSDNSNGDD